MTSGRAPRAITSLAHVILLTGSPALVAAGCDGSRAAGRGGGDGGAAGGSAAGAGGSGGPAFEEPAEPPAWADWPMPNQPGGGLPNEHAYTVVTLAGDEAVRDEVTGLTWQRHAAGDRFSWQGALDHCDALTLGGRSDWRLPSRIELVSLLDLTSTQPTIDRDAFPDTQPEGFWTATPAAGDPASAWDVYFYFGYIDTSPRDSPFPARCVLGPAAPAQAPPPADASARYDLQAETARDRRTGLTWQRTVPAAALAFGDAGQYCAALTLAGRDDWRLPSLQEFQTIVDEGRSQPATDPVVFPDSPVEGFWSGTPWAGTAMLGWHTDFGRGSAAYDLGTMPYRVRCARSGP